MLAVSKSSFPSTHLLLALALILLSFRSGAQDAQSSEVETTGSFTTKNEWLIDDVHDSLQIMVIERDFGEPVIEPLRIVVGYQQEGQNFHRLTAKGDEFMSKTFCQVDEPFVVDRNQFMSELGLNVDDIAEGEAFYEAGLYLVIPVHKYSDEQGDCEEVAQSVEAYWIQELVDQASSED